MAYQRDSADAGAVHKGTRKRDRAVLIGIVDYELGNLRSVAGAVERLGHNWTVTNDPSELKRVDKLIIPGVGAFGDGMANLRRLGLVDVLNDLVLERQRPILGICLGCELMAQDSEEFGYHLGLGWVNASILRFRLEDQALRVPHVGWNELVSRRDSMLLQDIPDDALFYYVHSYYVQCHQEGLAVAEAEYGIRFTAVFQRGNIFATQFHPEKSQRHGLTLLRNFIESA